MQIVGVLSIRRGPGRYLLKKVAEEEQGYGKRTFVKTTTFEPRVQKSRRLREVGRRRVISRTRCKFQITKNLHDRCRGFVNATGRGSCGFPSVKRLRGSQSDVSDATLPSCRGGSDEA